MYHAVVGGIMGHFVGGDILANASSAAINKLISDEIKKVAKNDPAISQWLSAALGAVVSEITANNVQAGSSIAVSGMKHNEFAKKDVESWYVIGKIVSNLDFSDIKDGEPIFSYMLGGGMAAGLGAKVGLVVTPDKVYMSLGEQVGLSAFASDGSANKVYILKPGYDLKYFVQNKLSIPKDAYVSNLEEYNQAIKGASMGVSAAIGLNVSASITPQGYTIISSGVSSNVGVSGDYSITW